MTAHQYEAYGLCWRSEFVLGGLPACARPPDVTIRQWTPSDGSLADGADGGNHLYFRYLDWFEFRADRGERVIIRLTGLEDRDVIRAFILGTVMAIVFRQRGATVLHASGVAKDGRAIGFVGESGWGKSTLAEFFCQRGYTLITDDVLVIQDVDAGLQVLPGYPLINLRANTGYALRADFEELAPIREGDTKRIRNARDAFTPHPVDLAGLYILSAKPWPELEIVPLPPHLALAQLVCHMHGKGYVTSGAYRLDQMRQSAALARRAPIKLLRRVDGLEALPELFAAVEADLQVAAAV